MNDLSDSPRDPLDELAEADKPWWRRFSRHGEFPWSTGASMVLHLFMLLLMILALKPFFRADPTPPAVDVLYVEDDLAMAGQGSDMPEDELAEPQGEESLEELPEDMPIEELDKIEETEPIDPELDQLEDFGEEVRREKARTADVRERIKRAKGDLDSNLREKSKSGGAGGAGRAARPVRWIVVFKYSSVREYLAQLDGLGATIAFPLSGDQWLYFDDVSSSNPRSQKRNLADENRLYWLWQNAQLDAEVCSVLGGPAPPSVMFLPLKLEDRMLKLELAYANLEEDEILSTRYEVVRRGGGYDVIVVSQVPK